MNRFSLGVRLTCATLLLVASVTAQAQRARANNPLTGLDAYIERAMQDHQIPGLAIAVVRNDSVVYAKGFGVRKLGSPERVDENTLFAIGSASKSFTGLGVAMLVDEGKVKWDDPATKYLPGFQLYDPYATRELTVRDLLSHRSGLARGDLMWYGSSYSRQDILDRVRYLKPSWSFRSQFGYQNIMYLAAGELTARVSGMSWDQFVERRIFQPLGMTASNTTIRALANQNNVAQPHSKIDDTVRVISWRNIDNIAPAGSINSNVLDMAKYVRFQLNSGKWNGKALVTGGNHAETWTPHTVIPLVGFWKAAAPGAHLASYGLGWFLQDYRNKLVVQHGGNIDGMSAHVALLPEEKTGVVVLTNLNGAPVASVLAYRVFDHYLGAPLGDHSADVLKFIAAAEKQAKETLANLEKARKQGTKPALALSEYAGTYSDSMYGEAKVTHQGGTLRLQYGPAFDGTLEHWHYESFRSVWKDRGLGKSMVTFTVGSSGKPTKLEIEGLAEFTRAPDKADTTAKVTLTSADLPKFAGKFKPKDIPVEFEVQVVGGQLKFNVPGQPVYTLVPESQTRFKLTGGDVPAGFYLDYEFDGSKVKQVTLVQPAPQPTLVLFPAS
ncbi:MAG TPA: serine hydrolase [Gemmatimonadaceae bacterium]|nr:serine hydrolase [Gemmatimonadaceae bacterium]